ncbi:SHOCT domain-containing protein [Vogesella sp. XCS3]|uniref:SHOCT domain-containing protein n=1 Tax=Vogesella sp. XCS3 TaxID=2877939 RepID=UPI001D0B1877|nr:SHOCT domain-containing protein [Vogesella sp. XCS3]UDM17894.1 SHOCT domain-containing protein [Vogesella sp. XCS3]
MEIIFLTWLILAIGVAGFADIRGRSAAGYGLLAFFLSPVIGLIVLLVIPDLAEEAKKEQARLLDEDRREEERRRQHELELESLRAITHSTQPASQNAAAASSTIVSIADELEKLAALRDKGVLTEVEFIKMKMDLLAPKA